MVYSGGDRVESEVGGWVGTGWVLAVCGGQRNPRTAVFDSG